jgi:hypothetical protein
MQFRIYLRAYTTEQRPIIKSAGKNGIIKTRTYKNRQNNEAWIIIKIHKFNRASHYA